VDHGVSESWINFFYDSTSCLLNSITLSGSKSKWKATILFDKLKTTTLAGGVAGAMMLALAPGAGLALPSYDGTNEIADFVSHPDLGGGHPIVGSCSLFTAVIRDSSTHISGSYEVRMQLGVDSYSAGGGNYWFLAGGWQSSIYQPISEIELATCAGVTPAEVKNFMTVGADGPLATDAGAFYGITFDLGEYSYRYGVDADGAVNERSALPPPDTTAPSGFMLGRANNLATNQPGLTRFLTGAGCGSFSASANENAGSVNGCASSGNTWASISSSWGGGNSYTLGTVGAHGFVNPDFLVGGMVQFDDAKDEANNASGTGWMVGPYFAAKAPDQPLFFEGRLLYGQTDNKISPLGASTDDFKTERMLAQLRATGEYKLQNTTLMPLFDLTYTDDAQKTYTDSLGNTIPGQKIGLTQVTAGMDFKTPLPSQSGALDLTGGLSGIYASTQNGAAAQQDFEGGRGRAHLGLNYTTSTGATLNAGTFYDGIGSKHEAYGASLDFNWKF
jgi:outer membrane autotransporter protein